MLSFNVPPYQFQIQSSSVQEPSYSNEFISNFLSDCRYLNLINDEELSQFSNDQSFEIKDNKYLDLYTNEHYKKLEPSLPKLFKDLILTNPELVKNAFRFRNGKGNLIFKNFADLFCFLAAPYSEWGILISTKVSRHQRGEGGVPQMIINFEKILKYIQNNQTIFCSLNETYAKSDKEDLGEHLTALRELNVPLLQLSEEHPYEIAFSHYHGKGLESSKDIALILNASPCVDHNGAFRILPQTTKLMKSISNVYKISFKIISDANQIGEEIRKVGDRLKLLILRGHGNPEIIEFAANDVGDLNSDHLDSVFTQLPEETVILLEGCSTGKGENSIAQKIADASRRTVFAPNAPECENAFRFKQGKFKIDKFNSKWVQINCFQPS